MVVTRRICDAIISFFKSPKCSLAINSSGTTFTCRICFEEQPRTNLFRNPKCSRHRHDRYCTDCIIRYIRSTVDTTTTSTATIKCPAPTCKAKLDPDLCRTLLPESVFVRWCDAMVESYVLGLPRTYCPNLKCSALVVDECGGGRRPAVPVKKTRCLFCKKVFCFRCKTAWHTGVDCKFAGLLKNDNDRLFSTIATRRKWNLCPTCGHCVEKVGGCKLGKCRCGCRFCHKCGKRMNYHRCNVDLLLGSNKCRF